MSHSAAMSHEDLVAELHELRGSQRMARLTRVFPGEPHVSGFVRDVGERLVLVQQFHDFFYEGFVALRLDELVGLRSGENERFFAKILQGEGLLEPLGIEAGVDCTGWPELFAGLAARDGLVTIECEGVDDEGDDEFYLGRLAGVGADSLELLYLDALGRWEEGPTEIGYDTITLATFGTCYLELFGKYAGS